MDVSCRQKGELCIDGELRPRNTDGKEGKARNPKGTYRPWDSCLHILLAVDSLPVSKRNK